MKNLICILSFCLSAAVIAASGCNNSEKSLIAETLDDVCHRVEDCAGTTFSQEEMKQCHYVGYSVGMILPDPENFADCFNKLTCNQLINVEDNPDSLVRCIDLDPATVYCQDDENLLACSNGGVCSAMYCPDVCDAIGATAIGCGENDEHPYEACLCAL
ncbi:MAG: hypothetical protein JXX14_22905 [Deltaproteobacteria bacterium]|nr:hypothetical protein [Deltaproteobacteria bacterium]